MTKRIADMTPEEVERVRALRRAGVANLSPEQQQTRKERRQQNAAQRSPEDIEIARAQRNDTRRKREALRTESERKAQRARINAGRRMLRAKLSPEARKIVIAKERKWKVDHPLTPDQYRRWMDCKIAYVRDHRDQINATERRRYARKQRARASQFYASIRAVVPQQLPGREDIINDIALAVFEKKLRLVDIAKRAPEFIRAHNRDNDHFKTVSLNECLPGTDLARIDTITQDDLPW